MKTVSTIKITSLYTLKF